MAASLVALGAALRFYQLGAQSLWIDEAATWFRVSLPWSLLLPSLRNGPNLPTSYALVKLVTDVFGDSEFWLRFPSAFFGTLAIPAAIGLGRRIGGKAAGLLAGWFWAVHPLAIFYARDAKTYAITSFLALSLLWLHLRMKTGERSKRQWAAVYALLLAGLLSHYFFAILAGLLLLSALQSLRSDPDFFRRWALATILCMLPLLLWVAWFYALEQPMLGNGWIDVPTLTNPLLTLWNLLSGYGGQLSPQTAAFGLVGGLVLVAGLVWGQRRREAWLALGLALALPMGAMLLVAWRKPLYMDRYFIVLLPVVTYLVASGGAALWARLRDSLTMDRRRRLVIGLFAGALLLGAWVGSSVHMQSHYAKEDWRGLAAHLRAVDGQNAELLDGRLIPLWYYYQDDYAVADLSCESGCWEILRRAYMPAHEFTSAIDHTDRPWRTQPPSTCTVIDEWVSPTNLIARKLVCSIPVDSSTSSGD
jgi:uncharacterized membrane protein